MDQTEITDRINEDADTVNFTSRDTTASMEVPVRYEDSQKNYDGITIAGMSLLVGVVGAAIGYYLMKPKKEQEYLPIKDTNFE